MTDYEELVREHGYMEAMVGKNSDGDNIIVSIDKYSASIRTLQKNGWMRINIYYPDGTYEELYEK